MFFERFMMLPDQQKKFESFTPIFSGDMMFQKFRLFCKIFLPPNYGTRMYKKKKVEILKMLYLQGARLKRILVFFTSRLVPCYVQQ